MSNVIIGTGNTARIVKMFFPNSLVIAKDTGFQPPLCEFWDTPYTRKFIKEFGLKAKRKKVTFKYVFDGDKKKAISAYNELTFKPKNNKPSMGKKSFWAYDISLPEITPNIFDSVSRIDLKNKEVFAKNNSFHYNRLFWCAPIKDVRFNGKLAKQTFSMITVCKIYSTKEAFKSNYLYLLDKKYLDLKCYRVTKKKEGMSFSYGFEFAGGTPSIRDLTKFYSLAEKDGIEGHAEFMQIKTGHIIKGEKLKDKNDAWFIGRFAQSNHELLQSDVVKKCYQIRKFYK